MKQKIYWKITVVCAVLLVIITFSPLIIAPGKTKPELFAMPYTLWISILISILLVILTYIGGLIYLKDDN